MPIYDALYDSDVKHFLCRHEQGAAFSAVGYARAAGKVGVCFATSGPGATNLITGLADALAENTHHQRREYGRRRQAEGECHRTRRKTRRIEPEVTGPQDGKAHGDPTGIQLLLF